MPFILYPKKLHGATQKFGEDFAKELLKKLDEGHGITIEPPTDITSDQIHLVKDAISEIFESYKEHEKLVELKPKDETDKEGSEEYDALIDHLQNVHDQIVEMLKFCENSEGGINITQLMYSIVSGYFPNLE